MKYLILVLLLLAAGCHMTGSPQKDSEVKKTYHQISQDEAKEMMTRDDGHVIVDVRRQDEYDAGHIPGAILIPNESIGSDRPEQLPDLDQVILIYCRSGNRSKQAAQKLADLGYTSLYEFGGINTWTGEITTEPASFSNSRIIYLAGGCFWGVQKFFDQFAGVIRTETGYANGPTEEPAYEDVCNGSGHAETVRVEYDETLISLTELLEYYFMVIDPLSYNRQGPDEGVQYRTGIYWDDPDPAFAEEAKVFYDKKEAESLAESYEPLAVELASLRNYYPAEEYHQKYLDKNPRGYCHIPRRMMQLGEMKAKFPI